MPQVEISIGGRTFEVACQEGEEHFLHTAANMLDIEATSLSTQIGWMIVQVLAPTVQHRDEADAEQSGARRGAGGSGRGD